MAIGCAYAGKVSRNLKNKLIDGVSHFIYVLPKGKFKVLGTEFESSNNQALELDSK